MKIEDIKPNPNNPRTITKEKLAQLKSSLERNAKFMKYNRLKIDENNMILGGNQRFTGLVELGYKDIPDEWIEKVLDLNDQEKREFIVMDNVNFGDWDYQVLGQDYNLEEVKYWGVEIPIEEDPPGLKTDMRDHDDVPTTKKNEFKVKTGDTWRLGDHLLVCGDSTKQDTFKKLIGGGEMADCIITDPPYNVDYKKGVGTIDNDNKSDAEYLKFLFDAFRMADSGLKPGATFYIWHASWETVNNHNAAKNVGWLIKQLLVWNKHVFTLGRQDYQWKHELCLYGWKPGAGHKWYADRKQVTVLDFDRPMRSKEHPTMKPINLITYQITNSTKPWDIVLDMFGGSGTTLISCENTKRRCRMVEYDPHYCSVIIKRWQEFTKEKAEKL